MSRPREEDFESRSALGAGTVRALAQLAEARSGVRRKERTDEERLMLARSALVATKRRVVDGRLERLGPRDYALHSQRR